MLHHRLRGALVGYGFIAENGHLPAYEQARDTVPLDIVAIADTCPARLHLAKQRFPNVRVYESWRELMFKERGTIDFVDVTTPPYEHATIANAALDAGLHVLCEKPMARTGAEAQSMIDHALKAGRVLFPSHNYKHAPVVKAVRNVLDRGDIGAVNLVTLDTFRATHARGVSEWRPDWRREKRFSGGGIAMDHGSHTFYLAFEWLKGHPTAITAKMSSLRPFDTEDNFSCTITFPHGVAVAHLTWTAGVRKVLYTLHGEHGSIRVEDDDIEVSVMREDANGKTTWEKSHEVVSSDWMDASHVKWFGSLLGSFAGSIEKREFVGAEAKDALACVQLIETAYASAEEGSRELVLPAA